MVIVSLQWRHDGRDNVSNHQPHDCFLNRLFRRRLKKASKAPRHWPLCAGNSPGTGEFPAQMASNAENVSIWWRQHDLYNGNPYTRDTVLILRKGPGFHGIPPWWLFAGCSAFWIAHVTSCLYVRFAVPGENAGSGILRIFQLLRTWAFFSSLAYTLELCRTMHYNNMCISAT